MRNENIFVGYFFDCLVCKASFIRILPQDCAEGTPTGEGLNADVLIAAQAKEQGAIVVTDNIDHFQYLGANYESW